MKTSRTHLVTREMDGATGKHSDRGCWFLLSRPACIPEPLSVPRALRLSHAGGFGPRVRASSGESHVFPQTRRAAKPFQHRSVLWLLLKNPVGCGDHRALDGHYVGDEFGGRPGAVPGTCSPEADWDSIRRPQQAVLCAVQFLEDRFKPRHDAFGQRLTPVDLSISRYSRYSAAPPACSKARASCNTRPSPKGGPKICKPTGSFPQTLPQGTEIPGTPAREPVTV
jgi:hypothetical protein